MKFKVKRSEVSYLNAVFSSAAFVGASYLLYVLFFVVGKLMLSSPKISFALFVLGLPLYLFEIVPNKKKSRKKS